MVCVWLCDICGAAVWLILLFHVASGTVTKISSPMRFIVNVIYGAQLDLCLKCQNCSLNTVLDEVVVVYPVYPLK